MPYYAQLNPQDVVVAVVETHSQLSPLPSIIEVDGLRSDLIGSLYDREASAAGSDPVFLPPPPAPAPEWEWLIDIGPFFDRFGTAKMAVLTSADPGVQAILKDTQIRKWIDLRLTEVAQSIAYIGSKVPEVTTELQLAILNTPVAFEENLALRKLYFS